MDFTDRNGLKKFLKDNAINDLAQLNLVFKSMAGAMLDELLEGERDSHLGYQKYDLNNKKTTNSRNGYSKKKVNSTYGDVELNIPRDRQGEFEPQPVGKYQKDIKAYSKKYIPSIHRRISITSL